MSDPMFFQAGIEIGNEPVEQQWQGLLVVHALFPELRFRGEDLQHLGDGVWLVPVAADEAPELLVHGLARHLEVPGVGYVSVEIPTT